MKKSPLQLARASYQPKLPASLQKGVVLTEGSATESVANQAQIQQLFPNTYGMPLIKFEQGADKEYHVNRFNHKAECFNKYSFGKSFLPCRCSVGTRFGRLCSVCLGNAKEGWTSNTFRQSLPHRSFGRDITSRSRFLYHRDFLLRHSR